MKQIFLLLLTMLSGATLYAQVPETEPNNTFATANELGSFSATVGAGTDSVDYFHLAIPHSGNIRILIHATNVTGSGAQRWLSLSGYDGRQENGQISFAKIGNITNPDSIPDGISVDDTMNICQAAAGDYYFAFKTNGQFAYQIGWAIVNENMVEDGPDESFSTAIPVDTAVTVEGTVMYRLEGVADTADYFSAVLPSSGTLAVIIHALNNSCSGNGAIRFTCYGSVQDGAEGKIYDDYVGLDSTIAPYGVADQVVIICSRPADSVYFKFTANGAFSYTFRYDMIDVPPSDPEPNGDISTAAPASELQNYSGNIGFPVDGFGNYDADDYYRIILPADGTVKVFTKVTGRTCDNRYQFLQLSLIDKGTGQMYSHNLVSGSLPYSGEVLDTLVIRGIAKDTVYLDWQSTGAPLLYEFKYQLTDTTTSDAEPNNSPNQALPVSVSSTRKGNLRFKKAYSIDGDDYYKMVLPFDADLKIFMKATYRGDNNAVPGTNKLDFICTNQLFSFHSLPAAAQVYADSVYLDTFRICALSADTIYFKLSATNAWQYEFRYEISDTLPPDSEPNNSFEQALPVAETETKVNTIGNSKNGTADVTDYFRAVLPRNGTIKMIVQATNSQCGNGALLFQGSDYRKSAGLQLQKYVANSSSISPGTTINDTIYICSQAADTFYFRFSANTPLIYRFRYEMADTAFQDAEPNNDFAHAVPFPALIQRSGSLNYITNRTVADSYDYYRLVTPKDGTIKIMTELHADSCSAGQWILMHAYDSRQAGGQLLGKYIPVAANAQAGQIVYDTTLLCGMAADTFYIRLEASNAVNYTIKYDIIDTSQNDNEPNGTFAEAIQVTERQVKKGHIRYLRNGVYDADDYYRTVLPKDGTLKVMVQATNRSCADGQWMMIHGYGRWKDAGQIFGKYIPSSANLAAGQTAYDTILICGQAADTFYFQMSGSSAFSYQLKYEMVDTSINDNEPNGTFAHAIPIAEREIKKGHIRYASNGINDVDDYYRTALPKDGTLKIMVQATNRSCTDGRWMIMQGYDRRQNGGLIFTKYIPGSANLAEGQTAYDTILVCGLGADTVYFHIDASSAFSYQLKYEMTDTSANDEEPNGSLQLSIPITTNQVKSGHIHYFANGIFDTDDFYKTAITTSDSLKVFVEAVNTDCSSNGFMILYGSTTSGALFTKYIPQSLTAQPGQTIYDSVNVFVTAPDTVYLDLQANTSFRYKLNIGHKLPGSGFSITGPNSVCNGGVRNYTAAGVVDNNVVYNWSLSSGGSITWTDSIATVNWTSTGTHTIFLYLSNAYGNSDVKQYTVVVTNAAPSVAPVAVRSGRFLLTGSLPAGATCQWFKNNAAISLATDSSYYATDSGTYYVRFINLCGNGPVSNSFYFSMPVQAQTISFPPVSDIPMSPSAYARLLGTASSGLPVSYQLISGPGIVRNDTVFASAIGSVIVKARQQGDTLYSAAADKFDTIQVIRGNQVIAFPEIPGQVYSTAPVYLLASATSGLTVSYNVISGNAILNGNALTMTGAGSVTVQALQSGDANYFPALTVQKTFCIGVREIQSIQGSAQPCINTYRYTTDHIAGANYTWVLSGGGVLTTQQDTATIQWQTPGSYTLKVKVNTSCDTISSNELTLNIVTSNAAPVAVSNMLPVNNAVNQQLPLSLSWIPGQFTVNYDLFVWDADSIQPASPYASNINGINYVLPANGFLYNHSYKWRVIAKNPCSQTAGPVQQFSLIPLPDLVVSDVQAPLTAFSGQSISLGWRVTNTGPGRTNTNQSWTDAVFLSFDTIPNFSLPPEMRPGAWNQLQFPVRPLLIASRPNVSALDSGQHYTNAVNFTLPLNYGQPLYVYVITNYPAGLNAPLQVTRINDTAHAPFPVDVTLSPTPDLRVDTVFTPTSTFSGSTVNITYKVKNYGVVTPAGASWNDNIYISSSPFFSDNTAVLLKTPKYNGTFYYGAPDAVIGNAVQLGADSSYTKTQPVVIPNFLSGTYFIYVLTNAGNTVYEGALSNNNAGSNPIQVFLTPTPTLIVSSLTLPVTAASTTQQIGINWVIRNTGLYNNIELNKGHYLVSTGTCLVYPICQVPNCVAVPSPGISVRDSVSWGSSFWKDKIYLSTNPSVLIPGNATLVSTYNHGLVDPSRLQDNLTSLPPGGNCIAAGTPLSQYNINTENVIKPGAEFPSSMNFVVPGDLPEGNYYVYAYANADHDVFEYPGTAQIRRSALPFAVQRPDLTPPTVTVPASVTGGQVFPVTYTVQNAGPGSVYYHVRKDRIYISTVPVFNASAQLIATETYAENIPAGTTVTHSLNYNFPASTSGQRYIYVFTNADSLFRERNMNNNISASAAISVSPGQPADLTVSAVQVADTVFSILGFPFKYTVPNQGPGTVNGNWTDSLFISCSPSWSRATSYPIAVRAHQGSLTPGVSYTDSFIVQTPFTFDINPCFAQNISQAYFYVKTNSDNGVYEGGNTANNVAGSGLRMVINPLVDHIVPSFSGPDTATVGRNYPVSWTVKNTGYNPGYPYYYQWYDGVLFSPDSVFNNNATIASQFFQSGLLGRNQSYSDSKNAVVPNIPTGDYYVLLNTDVTTRIYGEKIKTNNTNLVRNVSGAAKKIHVIAPLLPDLTDSLITAPVMAAVGQPLAISYKVSNNGAGITYPGNWTTDTWLSADFIPGNAGDIRISSVSHNGALQPGQSFTDTAIATLDLNMQPGNYVLIVHTNPNNAVFESNNTNNLSFRYLTVFSPAPADLTVEQIAHSDTAWLGYPDTSHWQVVNLAANTASGISADGIYLSKNATLDASAVLQGIKTKQINILPVGRDTVTQISQVSGVTEGNYYVFVKTDLLNNIVESNKNNNTGVAASQMYVKVKELPMNILTANTLQTDSRYYKLIIPDSLRGATIQVSLKTNDSLTLVNQLFIGLGYIPSAAHFDYAYTTPNYGNQQIVMSNVVDSVYYIAIRCVSPYPPVQQITLKAVKLPFTILNVNANAGGNSGNVTVKISGSLFTANMTGRLYRTGNSIDASAIYFVNSTTVYATFNLQGRSLGVYSMELTKADSSVANLANCFSVVPPNNGGLITGGGVNTGQSGSSNEPGCDPGAASGLNSQLVLKIVIPEQVFAGWPFLIQVSFNNPTNVDIPVQTRILYSDDGVPVSLTQAGLADGNRSLYLQIAETDGPPNIIRAGGSGVINVYSKPPSNYPGHKKAHYTLK